MREKIRFISLAMVLTSAIFIFGMAHRADANSGYRDDYNNAYGTSVSCSFCHTSPPALNATGTKFMNANFNVASIAPVPTVSAFTIPATSTSLTVTITTLTATDNVPITGYMVTESSTPPTASTAGWSASAPTSYVFAAAGAKTLYAWAKDAANVVSTGVKSASTTISVGPPPDTTAPTATIMSPTSNPTYPATTTPLSISGSASDTVGVTQVTWSNNRGGSGTCTGTTSWSASGIALLSGQNVITVTARDAAGNTGTDTLTVTYTPPAPPPTTDTTPPTATITGPTSNPTFSTTTTPLSLSGSASDTVGVTQVTWSNDRGGSGTCTGTTSWSASGITLASGQNVITVTARDAAGNTGTDTLTVTYTPPAPPPTTDTTPPTATITGPTSNPTYPATTTPLSISGSASDTVGVTQVTWSNNRGGSGTCTGTTSWSASGIALLSGQNVITVTARDAAGNTGTDTLTVTYTPPAPPPTTDTTPPTATITGPTSNPAYSTTTTPLSLSGSASDTVGVTQVTWSNDRGGSGTCTGTTSWSASGITLASGQNVITVTARDAAGNTGTNTLTVTYTSSAPPPDTAPDMSLWIGQWFKVSIKIEADSFGNTSASNQQSAQKDEDDEHGVFNGERDRERIVGYLKIWSWDPDQKLFQTDLYESDGNGGWIPESVPLQYVGGDSLDHLSSFQSTGDSTIGFAVRIRGKEVNGVLKGTIRTLGGYHFEVDNASNPPGFWAGEFSMNGTLVQEPKVPVPAGIRAH